MATDKILDRVRKLLELSHSTNEHEAAQAAARAAELMSEHDVTAAMLQVSAEEPTPYIADQAWLDNGADLAAVGQMPRPWKGAFRVGAADTIAHRLYEQLAERAGKEKDEASRAAVKLLGEGAASTALVITRRNEALEVVRKDRQEVKDAFEKMTKGWRKTRAPGGSQRAKSGYSSGVEAGKTVQLSGGKALGAGK